MGLTRPPYLQIKTFQCPKDLGPPITHFASINISTLPLLRWLDPLVFISSTSLLVGFSLCLCSTTGKGRDRLSGILEELICSDRFLWKLHLKDAICCSTFFQIWQFILTLLFHPDFPQGFFYSSISQEEKEIICIVDNIHFISFFSTWML